MPGTQDFENLIDDPGVRGVSYEPDQDQVVVLVEKKIPEDQIPSQELIRNRVPDHATDVVEVGEISAQPEYEPEIEAGAEAEGAEDHRGDQDPPVAGASEIQAGSTAATAGLLAEVTDPDADAAEWASSIEAGSSVRVSNAHVYGDSTDEFGNAVLQPSPYDGGGDDDAVGDFAGYVPLGDDYVDAAARACGSEAERDGLLNLAEEIEAVRREGYGDLKGGQVCKSGRTTGVTTGEVVATSATVNVGYGGRTITKRDQLITEAMSAGGDSGSPVLEGTPDDPGALVGHVFAGSDRISVINKAARVEARLGVRLETAEDQDHTSERNFEDYVEELLIEEYGEENVSRQHQFSNQRYADFLVFDYGNDRMLAYELENDSGSLVNGVGQAMIYAQSALEDFPRRGSAIPVLCFPAGHIDEEERKLYQRAGVVLREVDAPDDVDLSGV